MNSSRTPYNPSPPQSLTASTPQPQLGGRPRPPRIQIFNGNGSYPGSKPSTAQIPFTAQTNPTVIGQHGQPYWPAYANPFAAGNFMAKGFDGFVDFTKSGMSFGEKFTFGLYEKFSKWSKKWFTHIFLFLVVVAYTAGGAFLFQKIEQTNAKEVFDDNHLKQKSLFKAVRQLAEDLELRKFEPDLFDGQLIFTLREHKDALTSFINNNKTIEEMKEFDQNKNNPWTFVNAMFYCGTIYTTIGYGHISPQTVLGRSLTVIYAIIGIPLFLILLADFGKLFTRSMKFVWAYVRRIYYTGTCRKVRKQQQVMDVFRGFNTMYDYAVRKPSNFINGTVVDVESVAPDPETPVHQPTPNQLHPIPQTPMTHVSETPTTPYPETYEVDDEFNLPISLASIILVSYIFCGAFVYTLWEDWTYFEAFYFVFVSMSTIGFGDLVPQNPIFMMCSIIYLVFGLALTAMFLNVVQIKLSDTFKGASAKIGATIGLAMEEGSDSVVPTPPGDIPSIHIPTLRTIGEVNDEDLSPSDVIHLPPPNLETAPPPLLPRKGSSTEPEEKPKKKKGFFK